MGRIDYEKLRQLEVLLDDEVINQEEYNAKVAQLCSVPINNISETTKAVSKDKKSSVTIVLAVVICALLAACLYLYAAVDKWQKEAEHFRDRIVTISKELTSYKFAVNDYYLDYAVYVIEGDNTYYHRCNCDSFPSDYTYCIYNIDKAKEIGYKECPLCFGEDAEQYVKNHF